MKKVDDESFPEFERLLKYDEKQLREQLLPAYRRMLVIFIEKMYLAEPSTRTHLGELINYLEAWNRAIDGSLPREVVLKLYHSEKRLHPFYEDLERNFVSIQRQLAAG
jgi:hypothetical protein